MLDTLPLFSFKPTLCWVDDDQLLLEAIKITFKDQYHCQVFNNPCNALNFFETYTSPLAKLSFSREIIESEFYNTKNNYPIGINLSAIANIHNFSERHDEVAVCIIDYNMPEMNGLELCKQLQKHSFKKILLTGDATHEKAVEAFNNGLIDHFLRKDANVTEKLQHTLDKLIKSHFLSKTKHLTSHFNNDQCFAPLDPAFVTFFHDWCNKNAIIEHYLIDRNGSFLVKNAENNLFIFVCLSDTHKNEFVSLYDDANAEQRLLIEAVKSGTMLPFFGIGKEAWEFESSEWKNYFYPAQVFHGQEPYYWTVISN